MVNIANASQQDYDIAYAYYSKGKVPLGESPTVRAIYNLKYAGQTGVKATRLAPSYQRNTEVTYAERVNAQKPVQAELNKNLAALQAKKEAYNQQQIAAQQLQAKNAQSIVEQNAAGLPHSVTGVISSHQNDVQPSSFLYPNTIESIKTGYYNEALDKSINRQADTISQQFQTNPLSFQGKEGFTINQTGNETVYGLNSTYFEKNIDFSSARKEAYDIAQQKFYNLPTGKKLAAFGGSVNIGTQQFIIGTGEFGLTILKNAGIQQINNPSENKILSFNQAEINNQYTTRIKNYPSNPTSVSFTEKPVVYVGEKFLESPTALTNIAGNAALIGAGTAEYFAGIKAEGFAKATKESAGALSPIKIKPGIYTDTKEVYNIALKTDQSTRYIFGRGEAGLQTARVEYTSAEGSAGIMATKAPFIKIDTTGEITTGVRETLNPYVFTPEKFGKVSTPAGFSAYDIKSGIGAQGKTTTFKGIELYSTNNEKILTFYKNNAIISKAGGANYPTKFNNINYILSGKSKPVYKLSGEGKLFFSGNELNPVVESFTYQPESYKISPQTRGLEIDLTKPFTKYERGLIQSGSKRSSSKFFNDLYSNNKIKLLPRTTSKSIQIPSKPLTQMEYPSYVGGGFGTGAGAGVSLYKPISNPLASPSIFSPVSEVSFAGMAVHPSSNRKITLNQEPMIKIKRNEQVIIPPATIVRTNQKDISNNIFSPMVIPFQPSESINRFRQIPAISPAINQNNRQEQRQRQLQSQSFNFRSSGITTPFNSTTSIPNPTIFFPPIKPSLILDFSLGTRRFGASQRKKYTPSFESFVFNIRGKQTKTFTGFERRPIPKGFSFAFGKIKLGGFR